MKNKGKEKFTFFTGCTVAGVFIKLLRCFQCNFFKCADIHRQIVPTGLINIVVNILGFHQADNIFSIKYAISVGVCHVVCLHPTLYVVLRHIKPESKGTCIFKYKCFTVYTKSDPRILFRVWIFWMYAVSFKAHRVVAIMNLTVCTICQWQSEIIIPMSTLSIIDDIPFINVCLTAFKVPNNMRSPPQLEFNSCCRICTHIKGCWKRTGGNRRSILFVYGYKTESFKSAKLSIVRGKCYVILTETNFKINTAYVCRCLQWDSCSLSERNGYDRLLKEDSVRNSNCDLTFANDFVIVYHLSGYRSDCTVRCENAVRYRAHSVLFYPPLNIIGNLNLCSDGIGTEGFKRYSASRSIVIIFGFNRCTHECSVCGSSWNNKECICCRSFTTVRKWAIDFKILAGALCAKRSRASAITVGGIDTAHLNHIVAHFMHGKACGVRSLLAIGNRKNNFSFCCNAHKGSWCNATTMINAILIDRLSVFIRPYKERPNRKCVFFPTGKRIAHIAHLHLRHIIRSLFAC